MFEPVGRVPTLVLGEESSMSIKSLQRTPPHGVLYLNPLSGGAAELSTLGGYQTHWRTLAKKK